jgi:undecaprenyl-diphosphatase
MSVPVILGAILISGYKAVTGGENIEIVPILFGVITATLTGYIAIKIMLKVIKNANYKWFSLYLVIMAISSIISKIAFGV